MNKQEGPRPLIANFREAFIVVVVILLVAGFLYWLFPASQRNMRDWKAVTSIEQILEAQKKFFSKYEKFGSLQELRQAELIDKELAKGEKSGYRFTLTVDNKFKELTLSALPTITEGWWNRTGNYRYRATEDKCIHRDTDLSENFNREELGLAEVINSTCQ